jgi:hypothetical protein
MGVLISVNAFQVVGAGLGAKLMDYISFVNESKEKGGTGQIPVPP